MSEESQNTIQNFIICCQSKDVYIVRISSTEVCFVVKGYLEYFDEDVAKAVIANDNSCVYRPGGIDYSDRIRNQENGINSQGAIELRWNLRVFRNEKMPNALGENQNQQGNSQQAHTDVFHHQAGEYAQSFNISFTDQQATYGIDRRSDTSKDHL